MNAIPQAAPTLIYAPQIRSGTATVSERLVAMLFAIAAAAVLITAIKLPPSPTGTATHIQLGLQRCAFLERTGLPCMACGMTTSFAWFVRGNILASLWVQPMGAMLALLTTATLLVASVVALTGRPLHRMFALIPSRFYLIPFFALAIAAWGWKMWIVTHGIDGWH